ncbi:MAG: hypothetical protein O3A39_06880 [Proteobacteria bacterium]|nr:hypothetical protein [Pseudomonadota bacterium]
MEGESDNEAINKVKNLDSSTLDWKQDSLRFERTTYEIFVKSDQSTT